MGAEIAGTLGERVVIEQWQATRDAAGDEAGAWEALDTVFAAVQPAGPLAPARGGEAARSGRRWRVLLRHREDVNLSIRLRWRGQLLVVRAVDPLGPGRAYLELLCEGQPA